MASTTRTVELSSCCNSLKKNIVNPIVKTGIVKNQLEVVSGNNMLAVVIDLYSRKIAEWSMSTRMQAKLVCDALIMCALAKLSNTPQGSTGYTEIYIDVLQ